MSSDFDCNYCGWRFSSKGNMNRHVKSYCTKNTNNLITSNDCLKIGNGVKTCITKILPIQKIKLKSKTIDQNQHFVNQSEKNADLNQYLNRNKRDVIHSQNNVNNSQSSITDDHIYESQFNGNATKQNINPDNSNNFDKTKLNLGQHLSNINFSEEQYTNDILHRDINNLQMNDLAKEIFLLKQELAELKNKPNIINVQANLSQTFNIAHFNDKEMDLYTLKKQSLGCGKKAFEWLNSILINSDSTNKFDFVKDHDIINPNDQKYPFELKSQHGQLLMIDVTSKFNEVIYNDNGTKLNTIGNAIVSNSVLKAMNEVTIPLIKSMYEYQDELRMFDYIESPIFQKSGKTVYDYLDKYKKIKPTVLHLKDICNLNKLMLK